MFRKNLNKIKSYPSEKTTVWVLVAEARFIAWFWNRAGELASINVFKEDKAGKFSFNSKMLVSNPLPRAYKGATWLLDAAWSVRWKCGSWSEEDYINWGFKKK